MSIHEQLSDHDSLRDLYKTACGLHNGLWRIIQDRGKRQLGCLVDVSDLNDNANAWGNGDGSIPDDKQALSAIAGALTMSLGLTARIAGTGIDQWRLQPDEAVSLCALFSQIKKADEFYREVNRIYPELVLKIFPRVDRNFKILYGIGDDEVGASVNRQIGLNFTNAMLRVALASIRHSHW